MLPDLTLFLDQALSKNQYDISKAIQEKFIEYLMLLEKWNKVFNLTAVRDKQDGVMLHILDSLSVGTYLHGTRIIDVGTGAGLPGIPLALMYPEKEFVLLDSNNKKTRFLTQVVSDLKIKNISVVHARCEDFNLETGFDSILSRAFASLSIMLDSTQHLLAEHGQFLAMKGVYPEQEINEIKNFTVLAVKKLTIQGLSAERHIVCIGR